MNVKLMGFCALSLALSSLSLSASGLLSAVSVAEPKPKKEESQPYAVILDHYNDPQLVALEALQSDEELMYCVLLNGRRVESAYVYRVFALDGEFRYCGDPYELDPKGFLAYRFYSDKESFKPLKNYQLAKGKILYLKALNNGAFKAYKQAYRLPLEDSFKAQERGG